MRKSSCSLQALKDLTNRRVLQYSTEVFKITARFDVKASSSAPCTSLFLHSPVRSAALHFPSQPFEPNLFLIESARFSSLPSRDERTSSTRYSTVALPSGPVRLLQYVASRSERILSTEHHYFYVGRSKSGTQFMHVILGELSTSRCDLLTHASRGPHILV